MSAQSVELSQVLQELYSRAPGPSSGISACNALVVFNVNPDTVPPTTTIMPVFEELHHPIMRNGVFDFVPKGHRLRQYGNRAMFSFCVANEMNMGHRLSILSYNGDEIGGLFSYQCYRVLDVSPGMTINPAGRWCVYPVTEHIVGNVWTDMVYFVQLTRDVPGISIGPKFNMCWRITADGATGWVVYMERQDYVGKRALRIKRL